MALLASPATTQPLDEMYGVGNARGERLPLVQVPTTAGTGSEVTPISILTTGAAEKKGVVSPTDGTKKKGGFSLFGKKD